VQHVQHQFAILQHRLLAIPVTLDVVMCCSETGKDAIAEKAAAAPVKSKGFLAYLTHGVDVNIFEVR
jgi:hypothetical protein